MPAIDHKAERAKDVEKIKNSAHPRKVVVAGPGTGKSHLFSELIKKKRAEGKTNFLAITFIGKLGDSLADDLCGLADTMTLHGYARRFVLGHLPKWTYYPRMYELIKEDLAAEGIEKFEIGDDNYKGKTKHYQAVGDADVVRYAIQICAKDPGKIPVHDLILIDEYQDFNAVESEFVDVLASKNEIVIVGDDDQALYEFKGASPSFIRAKHAAIGDFESHTLRFCSRCTHVVINYFHRLVEAFDLNNLAKNRIVKEYICYAPDKDGDSEANPKIHLIRNCPPGMIAYKIKEELRALVDGQKIKSVLVIGEGRSCESILQGVAGQLRNYGFRNVDYRGNIGILDIKQEIVDAYRFLGDDETSLLGWRILGNPADARERHIANAKTLKAIISGTPGKLEKIKEEAIARLEVALGSDAMPDKEVRKRVFIQQIKRENIHLARPLCNLDVTVCNILNSKGLGADVVFLVGFDQGKFPAKKKVEDSEVYQMLVALTRAKKRIYLVNTVGKKVSEFVLCVDDKDLDVENL